MHTETLPQHLKARERDDGREFGGVGSTALLIKGVVLNEIHGDELIEGRSDILGPVESCDEGVTIGKGLAREL